MKLRIILSVLIILTVVTTAFASTRALLTDQATLAASTFSTGTVDLQISTTISTNPTSTSFADQKAGFTDSILPGQTKSEPVWLKNASTDVDFDISAQTASISGGIDPTKVTVAFTPVNNDGTSIGGATTISHTIAQWATVQTMGTTLIHSTNSGRQRYKMDVTLDPSSTSGSISFDFIFTGAQTQ